ncbi:MAG: hypothetical protein MUF07_02560 [Steroidobacteraceae bacterium]|jgi:hypothetical protein|nr:hypothetical protein [Steroidobacteraceae bacterium]
MSTGLIALLDDVTAIAKLAAASLDDLRECIGHLVYFDTLVPTRERPAAVMRRPDGSWPDSWEKRRAKFIDGYKMDFFAEHPLEMLVPNEDVANQAWLKRRLTPHPARGAGLAAGRPRPRTRHARWSAVQRGLRTA